MFLTSMVVSFISDLSKVPKSISVFVASAVVFGIFLFGLSLPVICFRYSSFTAVLCTGFPNTATLLSLSNKNVWKVMSAGNLFNLFS